MVNKKLLILISLSFIIILILVGCQTGNNNNDDGESNVPTQTVQPTATERAVADVGSEESPQLATVIVTVVITNTPVPTETMPEEEAPEPTATPLPPEPTSTPVPEPTPMPTEEPVAVIGPPWLNLVNHIRGMAGLTAVPEQFPLTTGSELHSRYMVVNDEAVAHKQDVNNPLYDEAGHKAAKNGNIFATSQTEADYIWGMNFWVSAPFHLIRILDPGLQSIGYGDYVEAIGDVRMSAVLDVGSDKTSNPEGVEYPIFFPGNGTETWVVRHSLYEWPDPMGSCPGFSRPAGAPIIVQLGDGSLTPNVSSFSVSQGDKVLDACLFDETSYRNSDSYAQGVGRTVLDLQDAVVILPREPLEAGAEFTVQLVTNGETYTWSFKTIKRAPIE